MNDIRAIAQVKDFVATDIGLGIFFSIDVIYNPWRDIVHLDDDVHYVEYVSQGSGSITSQQIWKMVAQLTAGKINHALIHDEYDPDPALATCTDGNILVPGFADWKLSQQPAENIFAGYRERVKRIPRAAGAIVHITNAQDTIRMVNHENEALHVTAEFLDAPDLQGEIEYRLFLFPHPPDLSLNNGEGLSPSILLGTVDSGPPYILSGQQEFASLHAGLRSQAEIQGVLGLKRKQATMAITPSDAGTVAKANIFWGPGTYELGQSQLTGSGTLTATARKVVGARAQLTGIGSLSATPTRIPAYPWTPLHLGSKLALYLNADAITGVSHGGAINTWGDLSLNIADALKDAAESAPILSTAGPNGRKMVQFDTDFLRSAIASGRFINGMQTTVLFRKTGAQHTNDQAVISRITGSGTQNPIDRRDNLIRVGSGGTIQYTVPDDAGLQTSWTILTDLVTPTRIEEWKNGTLRYQNLSPAFTSFTDGGTGINIGQRTVGSTVAFRGDVVAIVVTDPLVDDERWHLEGFLAHFISIASFLPSDHPYRWDPPEVAA